MRKFTRRQFSNLTLTSALGVIIGQKPAQSESLSSPVEKKSMLLIPSHSTTVGTTMEERVELASIYGCDPTWLNDEFEKRDVNLPSFWIDRFPVTNSQYFAFVKETGARAPWQGGAFAPGQADHPVAGVSHIEAEVYAKWAGKRLPTAEEWETAASSSDDWIFPWGKYWPGFVKLPNSKSVPSWSEPGTQRIGSGRCGQSAFGLEDMAGQVCEWTATKTLNDGIEYRSVKGGSWLHRDPLSFRFSSAAWVSGFFSQMVGFRCALDGNLDPPSVQRAIPNPPQKSTASNQPNGADKIQIFRGMELPQFLDHSILPWSRGFMQGYTDKQKQHSTGFVLHDPRMGPWPICFFLFEDANWNDKRIMDGFRESGPVLQEKLNTSLNIPTYSLDFESIAVEVALLVSGDVIDFATRVLNKTDREGTFTSTSCFSFTSHPLFYDPEMLRTYQWTTKDGYVRLRDVPRIGRCIRWIAPTDFAKFGGSLNRAKMAVVSRDDRWTFATVRIDSRARSFSERGNTILNCIHTDAPLVVPPNRGMTMLQRLYFLEGGLNKLDERIAQDESEGVFSKQGEGVFGS